MAVKTLIRKTRTLLRNPRLAIGGKFVGWDNNRAAAYLKRNGVMDVLTRGRDDELPVEPFDLYNLHLQIRRRRPLQVLEFGIGFSTLVMAHALRQNYLDLKREDPELAEANQGMLFSIDTNTTWIENTKAKIPDDLRDFIDIRHSEAEACIVEGELCHRYRELPNIVPDFLYLDAPEGQGVKGTINGLGFVHEKEGVIPPLAADLLLFETRINPGFFMVIDARYHNMHFLRRHLKRRYRFAWNRAHKCSTFELIS